MSIGRKEQTQKIGNQIYHLDDYPNNDLLSKDLAETHEQVTDAYKEGTIDEKKD